MNMYLLCYASQLIGSYAGVGCVGHYSGKVEIICVLQDIHPIMGPIKDRRRAPISFTCQGEIITLNHRDIKMCIVLEFRSI